MSQQFVKLLLIGDSGVGKSCLLTRFCQDKFINAFYNTIGVDFKQNIYQSIIKNVNYKLQQQNNIQWDTAGQQRFRTITANYYKGAHGILIVFDLTSKDSLKNVNFWLGEIQKHANPNATLILVGNKCDMHDKREVLENQAQTFADNNGLEYVQSSAFSAANVELIFQTVAKNVLQKRYTPKIKPDIEKASENSSIAGLKNNHNNSKRQCC